MKPTVIGRSVREPAERGRRRPDRRGLTPLVGVVLLALLVILGSTVVVLTGGPALGDTRESVDIARAERAMTQVDAGVSTTALEYDGAATRTVRFGRGEGGGTLQTTDESWIRVELLDAETGAASEVVTAPLGTVVYTNDDTTVGYEAGGVWRSDAGGSVMLSPPEFHFREDSGGNGTLTLPVISVTGDAGLSERFRVERVGAPERVYPDEDAAYYNKVRQVKVRITVHSAYYEAWGRYFEANTDGFVFVDPGTETAEVTFLAIPRWMGLNGGIVATSGLGEIRLNGNSIYIDSYDSRLGSYEDTKGAEGSITAVNDITTTGTSNIQGEVRSGATVSLSGTTNVNGVVYWTDEYLSGGAYASGGDEQIEGVADIEPIDRYVLGVVADARAANDNDNAAAAGLIVDGDITGPGTLTAGTYYVRNIDLSPGDKLVLDTTDGDIDIAVEDTVTIDGSGKSSRIEVVGEGTVRMYVVGDEPVDFRVKQTGIIDVLGPTGSPNLEKPAQFRVYGTSDFDAVLNGGNADGKELSVEGVIYAPAGRTGTGSVDIGQAKFYGAIVTGDLTIKQGAEIHYDLGLADERFPRSPTVSRLDFMHVTKHLVRVSG